jgi:hypothetical protein
MTGHRRSRSASAGTRAAAAVAAGGVVVVLIARPGGTGCQRQCRNEARQSKCAKTHVAISSDFSCRPWEVRCSEKQSVNVHVPAAIVQMCLIAPIVARYHATCCTAKTGTRSRACLKCQSPHDLARKMSCETLVQKFGLVKFTDFAGLRRGGSPKAAASKLPSAVSAVVIAAGCQKLRFFHGNERQEGHTEGTMPTVSYLGCAEKASGFGRRSGGKQKVTTGGGDP